MTMPAQHSSEPRPITRPRRLERLTIVYGIIIVLLVGGMAFALIEIGSLSHRVSKEANGKQAAVQALGTANSSLAKNGLAPVATPTVAGPAPTVTVTEHATGPAGAVGAAGPGPTRAQIAVAVAAYCQSVQCGSGPTTKQVAQAVATYCNVDNECRGANGKNGVNATGAPGAAGASGAPGQNATADQIAAAVNTFCSQSTSPCKGDPGQNATGAPGANGTNGADGQPPVSWTYTTTDLLGNTTTHECSRTDPFDASAPTYTCN